MTCDVHRCLGRTDYREVGFECQDCFFTTLRARHDFAARIDDQAAAGADVGKMPEPLWHIVGRDQPACRDNIAGTLRCECPRQKFLS